MFWHLSLLLIQLARAEELVVLIPGLGDNLRSRPCMEDLAASVAPDGYRVVIADYQRRSSVDASAEALAGFIAAQEPERYDRVHLVAWILGGWSLNQMFQTYSVPKLATVIYDRSPTQERAPAAVVRVGRPFVWLLFGRLVRDLARTPYVAWTPTAGVKVGMFIENRATSLMVRLRGVGESYGPLQYSPLSFGQVHDDAFYTPLDHDRVYLRHDMLWPELAHFFQVGRFTDGALRVPMAGDPWQETAIERVCALPR